jgi:hypothetical protein
MLNELLELGITYELFKEQPVLSEAPVLAQVQRHPLSQSSPSSQAPEPSCQPQASAITLLSMEDLILLVMVNAQNL